MFGRVLPSVARQHYVFHCKRKLLRAWKELWWVERREWKLNIRAECHNRSVCQSTCLGLEPAVFLTGIVCGLVYGRGGQNILVIVERRKERKFVVKGLQIENFYARLGLDGGDM